MSISRVKRMWTVKRRPLVEVEPSSSGSTISHFPSSAGSFLAVKESQTEARSASERAAEREGNVRE